MMVLIYSAVIYQVLHLALYLQCLILRTLRKVITNYSHFTNEETEAQVKYLARDHSNKKQNQNTHVY